MRAIITRPPPDSGAALFKLGACMSGIATSFYLLLSTVPVQFARGGDTLTGGAITGLAAMLTVLATLAAPKLIPRLGRGRLFALAALLLGLPCGFIFSSPAGALLAASLRGAGLGFSFVSAGGLAAQLAPAERRGALLGLYGLAFSVPAIFAVPLGLWMLDVFGTSSLAAAAAASALLPLLGLGVFSRQEGRAMAARILPGLRQALCPFIFMAGGATALGVALTQSASLADALSPKLLSLAMLLHGVGVALSQWYAGRLSDRHGPGWVVLGGLALCLTALLLLAAADSHGRIVLGLVTLGVGFGALQNATLVWMLRRSTPHQADGVNVVWNVAYDAGLAFGAFAFGALASLMDPALAIACLAGLILLASAAGCVWTFAYSPKGRQPSPAQAPCRSRI